MTKTLFLFFSLGILGAFVLQNILSCSKQSNPVGPDTSTNPTTVDVGKINDGASTTESALKTGDPQKVLNIMTDDSKTLYTQGFSQLTKSQLVNIGKAIEQRTLTYYNPLYAEYKYTKDGISYTLAFALQSDGSWKLMRL